MRTRLKRVKEPLRGAGDLTLAGETRRVDWAITCGVMPGGSIRSVKGSIEVDPETARKAFRVGDARLVTEDGATLRLNFVAHSEGSGAAYFEASK